MGLKFIRAGYSVMLFLFTFSGFDAAAQRLSATGMQPVPYPKDAADVVRTYVNPVLGGDHPDPTLLKVGEDFYMCGSSFHFVPNLPILHSKDLLHWELIARVVPADWDQLKSGAPGSGVWQGAISYFYGMYHIYFSNGSGGGQYMSTAVKPSGPWTRPVQVKTKPDTGPTGYDNSIFVDDDGTPYMIIKPGQTTNRIQQLDRLGNLTGKLINLDWINHDEKYSWAEGPVMCKRNGWYYYFMAGDVTGGQFALRSRSLVADSTQWEKLGKIFAFSTDPENRFRSANHMSAPLRLNDGTWWCIAQSYDAPKGDDWSGQGRQDLLLQVQWTPDGRPFVPYSSDQPLTRPKLSSTGFDWRLPRSDQFESSELSLYWHFLNKDAATQFSMAAHPGWLTLAPKGGRTHILQKEAGRHYTLVTRLNSHATDAKDQAGLYLSSGNEAVNVRLYSGFENGRKIFFAMGNQSFSINNQSGDLVWLKLERNEHQLTAYCSPDGINWKQFGDVINCAELDKTQPNYNSWVGTSIGLYADAKPADFDFFLYKDGSSAQPLSGANNFFGVTISPEGGVSPSSDQGGWVMLGGVDLGRESLKASSVEITTAAVEDGIVEIWIDDLSSNGKKLAQIAVKSKGTGKHWSAIAAKISPLNGQHDIYLKIKSKKNAVAVKSVLFR